MFIIESYIEDLILNLRQTFGSRLLYVGLQGSYLRNEATEESDVDIMAVIDELTVSDLSSYKKVLISVGYYEKSCGFICGKSELSKWNPLEICHLINTTKDYYGVLSELVPSYSIEDEKNFIKISLDNMFHELGHMYIHSGFPENIKKLPCLYKSVFYILQNIYYLKNNIFISTENELIKFLSGEDKAVFETAIYLKKGNKFDFEESFSLLFNWCKNSIMRL